MKTTPLPTTDQAKSDPTARRKAASDEQSSNQKIDSDAYPMPEGYLDNLGTPDQTDEHAAYQLHLSVTEPSTKELLLAATIARAEKQVAAAKRQYSAERARRGVLATATTTEFPDESLADLPTGPAPDQLLAPFLAPDGPTVLFGPGGVGKGYLSTHFITGLTRIGHRVLVLDFETHRGEWGRRARALGMTHDQLSATRYLAPFDTERWTGSTGALIDIAQALRTFCDEQSISYLVLDSYSAAISKGDNMGGQEAASEFYRGIQIIGRPALVIAHVASASGRFPDKPFGSVFVHNYARETWAVESTTADQDQIAFDPSTDPLQPNVMSLELRNKKMNGGRKAPPQFINFSFFHDGHIEVTDQLPHGQTLADMAASILTRAGSALTTKQLVKGLADDFEHKATIETMNRTLNRNPMRFRRTESQPYTWSLV